MAFRSQRERGSKGKGPEGPRRRRPEDAARHRRDKGAAAPRGNAPPAKKMAGRPGAGHPRFEGSGPNLRAGAARVLEQVLDGGRPLKAVLHGEQKRLRMQEDRALLRQIAAGAVRNLPLLDWALEEVTARGLGETQRELRQILRVGAYQILFLERIPAYAAVHQCVEAAKRVSKGAAGFVNGILRTVAERREEFLEIPYRFSGPEAAALRHGMPEWLAARYVERFGPEEGEALLAALQQEGRTALLFPTPAAASQAVPLLTREGFKLHPDPLLPRTAWIEEGDPSESEAFRRGLFYLMDPASQAPAQLMPLKEERRVLDLCSAPGGKTVVLATRLAGKGWVLSADRSAGRMAMVRENVERLRLRNVKLARVDVGGGLPFGPVWPAVLLDAPCSSLGTLRRNPEIRWQIREADLGALAAKQRAFLEEAARVVAPSGVLGFSVCSIEPEETEEVVEAFLQDHKEFRPCSLRLGHPWSDLASPAGPGRFYLLPSKHPWDGFYMAFVRRRS